MDWAKTTARRDEKHLCLGLGASYIKELTVCGSKVYFCKWKYWNIEIIELSFSLPTPDMMKDLKICRELIYYAISVPITIALRQNVAEKEFISQYLFQDDCKYTDEESVGNAPNGNVVLWIGTPHFTRALSVAIQISWKIWLVVTTPSAKKSL